MQDRYGDDLQARRHVGPPGSPPIEASPVLPLARVAPEIDRSQLVADQLAADVGVSFA
jgi:hypothetical protein